MLASSLSSNLTTLKYLKQPNHQDIKLRKWVVWLLAALALFATYQVVRIGILLHNNVPVNLRAGGLHEGEPSGLWETFDGYLFLTAALWAATILTSFRLSKTQLANWLDYGLDRDTIDLMITKRGANSRFRIMENLDIPRNRENIARATGIDWREVTREIGVLENHGLVYLSDTNGKVKKYVLTGKGRITVTLAREDLYSKREGETSSLRDSPRL